MMSLGCRWTSSCQQKEHVGALEIHHHPRPHHCLRQSSEKKIGFFKEGQANSFWGKFLQNENIGGEWFALYPVWTTFNLLCCFKSMRVSIKNEGGTQKQSYYQHFWSAVRQEKNVIVVRKNFKQLHISAKIRSTLNIPIGEPLWECFLFQTRDWSEPPPIAANNRASCSMGQMDLVGWGEKHGYETYGWNNEDVVSVRTWWNANFVPWWWQNVYLKNT